MLVSANRRSFTRRTALGLGLTVLLAGCGPQAASTDSASMSMAMPGMTSMATASTAVADATPVATKAVTIQNFAFSPSVITVPVGSTVTWTNQDIEQHTVTARDKSFGSNAIDQGQSFSNRFTKAGTYPYFCEIHPYMVGSVIVTAA
jgi:plastocyanin